MDVYLPPKDYQFQSLLFQLVPTSYRARTYNRQLRREIEERPEGALIVWPRENSDQLYYVFHGMAGGLGIQPLTVLRETGLIHDNLVLLKDYYRFFYQAGLNREITDSEAIVAVFRDAAKSYRTSARHLPAGLPRGVTRRSCSATIFKWTSFTRLHR